MVFGNALKQNLCWSYLLGVSTFSVPCCDVRYDIRIIRCSVRLYIQLFVRGIMFYLRYLCLFAYSFVKHILCCVFVLIVFVLCKLVVNAYFVVFLFCLSSSCVLCMVVSTKNCVVFFVLFSFPVCLMYGVLEHIIVFCFILLVFVVAYPNVASFSWFSILEYPFLFSCV